MGEKQREGGWGGWTKAEKGLKEIRSGRSDRTHPVKLRTLVRGEAQALVVSVFPDAVSECARR
jgi:hypothetical protein